MVLAFSYVWLGAAACRCERLIAKLIDSIHEHHRPGIAPMGVALLCRLRTGRRRAPGGKL